MHLIADLNRRSYSLTNMTQLFRVLRKAGAAISVCLPAVIFSVGCTHKKEGAMTRMEFLFKAPNLPTDQTGTRPKTMYLAGDRFARIEQFADRDSDRKNLIIVSEPDIWLVDAVRKTVGHSMNHGEEQKVHNPILGPDAPEELLALDYGHELEFFERNQAVSLETEVLNNVKCDVREFSSGDYHVRLYVDSRQPTPVMLRAFNNSDLLLEIHYTSYQTGLPFQNSIFEPPKGYKIVEADAE